MDSAQGTNTVFRNVNPAGDLISLQEPRTEHFLHGSRHAGPRFSRSHHRYPTDALELKTLTGYHQRRFFQTDSLAYKPFRPYGVNARLPDLQGITAELFGGSLHVWSPVIRRV